MPAHRGPAALPGSSLTDLGAVLNDEAGEVLSDELVEDKLVGAVVDELLAALNSPLGQKETLAVAAPMIQALNKHKQHTFRGD